MKRVTLWGINPLSAGFLALVLMAAPHGLSATTLVVGNCKSGGYDTIQHAISAAPVGATVQVCPGQYSEQVKITQAVTLAGIIANNNDQVVIAPPSGGLTQTTTNAYGNSVAYQILVLNSSGAVNISNLWVFGGGNNVSGSDIAGIFYQNSFGTVNGVVATNQSGNGFGVGIWLEGGSLSPSVTVENTLVAGFDFAGIFAETAFKPVTELTAKMTGNLVMVDSTPSILLDSGTTATVTNNSVLGTGEGSGIVIEAGAAGSVSGNSIVETYIGIQTYADGVSVTSNRLSGINHGIDLQTPVGAVKGNILMNMSSFGINFNCNANPNVTSNTINYSGVGLEKVPSGLVQERIRFLTPPPSEWEAADGQAYAGRFCREPGDI